MTNKQLRALHLARQEAVAKRLQRPLTLDDLLHAAKNIVNMIHLVESMREKSTDYQERVELQSRLDELYLKAEKMGEVLQDVREELGI